MLKDWIPNTFIFVSLFEKNKCPWEQIDTMKTEQFGCIHLSEWKVKEVKCGISTDSGLS